MTTITDWDGEPITEPGIYRGMPDGAYHADPVPDGSFSSTMARKILETPAHLRHYLDSPREEKKEFDFGTAVHSMVLGVGRGVVEIPEGVLSKTRSINTNAAREFIEDARRDGYIPMKAEEINHAGAVADAVLNHDIAGPLFKGGGVAEQSAFAVDPDTGLWLRARADWQTPSGILVDFKTTRSAAPLDFERHGSDFGYHVQQGHYLNTWELATGKTPRGFVFVNAEKDPPYLVSVVEFDGVSADYGRRLANLAARRYKRALDTDQWPGYPARIHSVSLPPWVATQADLLLAEEES